MRASTVAVVGSLLAIGTGATYVAVRRSEASPSAAATSMVPNRDTPLGLFAALVQVVNARDGAQYFRLRARAGRSDREIAERLRRGFLQDDRARNMGLRDPERYARMGDLALFQGLFEFLLERDAGKVGAALRSLVGFDGVPMFESPPAGKVRVTWTREGVAYFAQVERIGDGPWNFDEMGPE